MEILDYMGTVYGLRYKVDDSRGCYNASGVKPVYYSEDLTAQRRLGYSPSYTSMETIISETKQILVGIQCDLIP
jgi:hypothetical protein